MATLEKIRNKSVLLFVIIIVALLAFILGDFLTSGRTYFGSGTTVAEAGDVKVDYTDYQTAMNQAGEQSRNQQSDNGVLAQQVIGELLVDKLLQKEYEDLGLKVTDNELTEALTGENIHPAAMQTIYMLGQALGMPGADPKAIYAAVINPPANIPAGAAEQFRQAWAQLEQHIEQTLLRQKFDNLVLGLYTANDLDAHSLYDDVNTTRHIAYAVKDLNVIDDKDAVITDDDRRAAWEENKGMYKLSEPIRSIDYIMVRIEPSQEDRAAGLSAVEDALLALNSSENLDAVTSDSRFVINRANAPLSQIRDNAMKNFLDSATVGQAVRLKTVGDTYTLAKLVGVSTDIDSINISFVGRTDEGSLDSLFAQVNSGVSFKSLDNGDNVRANDSVWTALNDPNLPVAIKDALTNRPVGEAFIINDTVQGQPYQAIYRVNRRHAPVNVYDVAEITFVVDPSQETLSTLSGNLRTFVSNNSSAADFAANAAEAGYTVLNGFVSASSPMVGNASDSRQAVKWLMENKAGKVMPVFQDSRQTYMLAAAIKNIYDDEYLPWNADLIADQIEAQAIANKKAQMLIDKYAGKAKDVDGYAQLMEVSTQHGDAMFTAPMLATIGYGESALQGIMATAPQGTVVGPVKGNSGVVVFTVTGQDSTGREYSFDEYALQFNRALNLGNSRALEGSIMDLLLGGDKVENHSLNFIQGLGE